MAAKKATSAKSAKKSSKKTTKKKVAKKASKTAKKSTKKKSTKKVAKKSPAKKVTRKKAAKADVPTYDEIAARAYQVWERKGCPDGQDMANWRDAEAELLAERGLA